MAPSFTPVVVTVEVVVVVVCEYTFARSVLSERLPQPDPLR